MCTTSLDHDDFLMMTPAEMLGQWVWMSSVPIVGDDPCPCAVSSESPIPSPAHSLRLLP